MPSPEADKPAGLGQRLGWLAVIGSGFLGQFLLLVTGVLTARMLGVEGRGQFALALALTTMGSQLTLGGSLPNVMTVTIAGTGSTARDLFAPLVRRWVLYATVPAALVAGAYLWTNRTESAATLAGMAAAAFLLTLLTIGGRLVTGSLLGERRSLWYVALSVLSTQVAFTVVIVLLFATDTDLTSTVALLVLAGCAAISLVVSLRLLAPRRGGEPASREEIGRRTLASYASSIGTLDGLSLDRILVGALLGANALGLYAAGAALASLASMFGAGLAAICLADVSAAPADRVARKVRNWVLAALATLVPVSAVVIPTAHLIIPAAFGEDFRPAVAVSMWLVAAGTLLGVRRVLIAILQALGSSGRASAVEIVLTLVLVGGILVSAANDSLIGVGITMTGTAGLACTALAVLLVRAVRARRDTLVAAG